MSDDYITLVGTIVFQRERSCYIRFDGIDYKGQFVPKSQMSGVDYDAVNIDVDIRVKRYYYNQHIKWRLFK